MREVAARDDQLGREPLDQPRERRLDRAILARSGVQVGEVQDSGG
jgi:hypothetical protein